MNVSALQTGDTFAGVASDVWETLTQGERKREKRVTFDRYLSGCRTAPDRIHVKTSAGTWCIPRTAPVTVIESVSRPTQGKAA